MKDRTEGSSKSGFSPCNKGIRIMASVEILKRNLMGRSVSKSDILALISPRKTRETFREFPDVESVFSGFFEVSTPFSLGEIKFTVVSTSPVGIVRITDVTEIEIRPEAVELLEKRFLMLRMTMLEG